MDSTDKKILAIIQAQGQLTASEIAEQIHLSQPPCWRRIKRLQEQGYIKQRVALLDRQRLGLNLVVYTEVKLTVNGRKAVHEFEEAIRSFPEVTECYVTVSYTHLTLPTKRIV